MLKKYVFVLGFLLTLIFPFIAKASHISGGDISYTCLGGNQYEITLNLFRDCSGITMLNTETVNLTSISGGCAATSVSVTLQGSGGIEVSQLCAAQLPNSTCGAGGQPGMEHYIYKGIVTLDPTCNWRMSWSTCCRNTAVNVPSSSGANIYLEATLNMASFNCNNSPTFTAQPIPYVCANQPVAYNYGVVETDGDSLRFQLVNGLTATGTSLVYGAGYSGTAPLPGITINPNTGQINFTPTTIGNFIVTIGVNEYTSTGVLKGTTMRDIQFVVQSCTNTQPAPSGGQISSLTGTANQTGPYSLTMCEGNSFTFVTTFTDPDPSDILTLTSNVTTALPGATITYSSGNNPKTATVSWTAPGGSAGNTNIFTITVADDACPIPGVQTMVYDVNVVSATTIGPDRSYCPAGGPVQLVATGGTIFTWSAIAPGTTAGLSCTNCPNPTATPTATTTYVVSSNLTGSCKSKDTVIVRRVPDFTFSISPTSATICMNGAVQLTTTAQSGSTYAYNWTPSSYLSSSTISNPLASPLSTTTYTVTASATGGTSIGCVRSLSVPLTVTGVAPVVTVTAADTTLCLGQSTTLTTTSINLPLACGVPGSNCSGTITDYTIGSGTTMTTTGSPYGGFYHDGRVQILYRKADLNAMGLQGGVIKRLAFYVGTKSSTAAYSGFTIKMGCTSSTTLTASFVSGLTQVYAPSNVTPTANSWNTYTLSGNGFEWDGMSNVIVEVCFNNSAYTSNDQVQYSATTYTSVIYDQMDSSPSGGCDLTSPSTSTLRPNIKFGMCIPPATFTYSWAPTAGLSSSTIANPTATPTSTTTYVVNVTNTATGCTGSKSIVIYVGGNPFTLSAIANSTICAGATKNLTSTPSVSQTYTYTWNPSGTLSSGTVQNPVASPGSTTTYSVTASAGGPGCTAMAGTVVTVKNSPVVTITPTDTTLCLGQTSTLNTSVFVPAVNCGTAATACTGTTSYSIGTGTATTTSPTPFVGFYHDGRIQMLYTKAELNAQGIVGGVIKSLGLRVAAKASTAAYSGFTIKMGCTSSSSASVNFMTGLTTVYGPSNYTSVANSWNTFTFPGNGYEWDGISNLVIEVCFDNNAYTSSDNIQYTTTTFTSVTYAYADGNTGCTMVGQYTSSNRPNIQLGVCVPTGSFTYLWTSTAPHGLSATNVASPTITSGASAPNAGVGSHTYNLTVTEAGACSTTVSQVISVGNPFTLTMSPSTTICAGSATQITAEADTIIGTLAYYWTPSNSLNLSNIFNPTASPTGNTVYNVDVVSSQGCSQSGSTSITVGPGNLSVTAGSLTSLPLCKGSSASLTANVLTAAPTCQVYAAGCSTSSTSTAIGSGSSNTTNGSPFFKAKNNSYKRQYIYTKTELDAAFVGAAGAAQVITGIGFDVASVGSAIDGLTISVGCIPAANTTFTSTTFLTGVQTVVNSFIYTPAGTGYQFITFDNPYLWDGTSNLVVQVCSNAKQGANGTSTVKYTSITNGALYYQINTTGSCNVTTGTQIAERPNVQFKYCAYASSSISYSWTPSAGLSSTTINNPNATPLTTTTYYVTAEDPGTGCNSTDEVIIDVQAVDAGVDLTTCNGNNATLSGTYIGQSSSPSSCTTLSASCSGASTNHTVGAATSTSTSWANPFMLSATGTSYKRQYLYTAAELSSAGLTSSGLISALAFDLTVAGSAISDYTVSLQCTTITGFTSSSYASSMTLVKSSHTITPIVGWNTITFDTPYFWDGTSSIIVEVCYNTAQTGTASTWRYTSVASDKVRYSSQASTGNCSVLTGSSETWRPQVRFTKCSYVPVIPTYSWSPAASIASGGSTLTPTTTNLTAPTSYIITATAGSCITKDTVVVNIAAPTNLTWTGTTNTDWFTRTNWNQSCLPECATTVTIPAATPNMPYVNAVAAANSVTVQGSASLTLGANAVLSVCGDFTNNGTFTANPASTVQFNNGSVNQNVDGTLTGANRFGHLLVSKTGGTVNLLQNIGTQGNFTTMNSTSVVNTNGKIVRVAGHFNNSSGSTTFTNIGTTGGTLEMNGAGAQNYSPGGSLTLNNVIINNTGSGVTLVGYDMNIGTSGSLTLTAGKVITGATYKVVVNNNAPSSVSTGNSSSFVQGFLRRYIQPTGSYDFPVGNATKGFQRANVNFTSPTAISYLTADFQNYATVPTSPAGTECSVTYSGNALDNGFWNIDANTANNNSGVYTMTLYNNTYTNAASGWTIMARHNGSATWGLLNGDGSLGQCVASPVTGVVRQNMVGFSKFGTAQSNIPLPIELLSFTGEHHENGYNHLQWTTASETNNDYFSLERLRSDEIFEEIVQIESYHTAGTNHYSFNDFTFDPKINYYRLKQTDLDGDFVYSETISIDNRSTSSPYSMELYPNPARTTLMVLVSGSEMNGTSIELVDLLGKTLFNSEPEFENGKSKTIFNVQDIPAAMYFIKVMKDGRVIEIQKFIKN